MFDELPTGPIAPYQRLGLSCCRWPRELGISVQWLHAELMAQERAQVEPVRYELPHVPIESGPSRSRWHYRLDHDQALPGCPTGRSGSPPAGVDASAIATNASARSRPRRRITSASTSRPGHRRRRRTSRLVDRSQGSCSGRGSPRPGRQFGDRASAAGSAGCDAHRIRARRRGPAGRAGRPVRADAAGRPGLIDVGLNGQGLPGRLGIGDRTGRSDSGNGPGPYCLLHGAAQRRRSRPIRPLALSERPSGTVSIPGEVLAFGVTEVTAGCRRRRLRLHRGEGTHATARSPQPQPVRPQPQPQPAAAARRAAACVRPLQFSH